MEPLALGVIVPGDDPIASLDKVRSLGLSTCQMMCPSAEWGQPDRAAQFKAAARERGITLTCVFAHFPGESYTDIPTIHRTCGLVPRETRAERIEGMLRQSDVATALGAPVLAAHIGFIPEDRTSADYQEIVAAMQRICDHCARNGQKFALETGQETAEALLQFIHDVDRGNLGVNFDPANMLLYGSGRPLEAVRLLGRYLLGVHAKDGRWPTQPGTLGEETPLGEGEVDFPAFIATLKELGYTGPITIEREISGEQQIADIRRAITLLESLRK